MEELIKKITEKAGISEDKAKLAAEAAMEFIQDRVAHTIDTKIEVAFKNLKIMAKAEVHEAITGEPAATFMERMGDFAEDAKDKLGDFADAAKDKLGDFAKSTKSFFGGLVGGKKDDKTEDKDEKKELK